MIIIIHIISGIAVRNIIILMIDSYMIAGIAAGRATKRERQAAKNLEIKNCITYNV